MTTTLGIAIVTSFLVAGTALAQTSVSPTNPCPPGQSQEKTNQPCAPTRTTPSEPAKTQSMKQRDGHAKADSAHGTRMAGKQDIKLAQEALKAKGYDAGAIDGAMGPRTRAALRDFQKAEGLRATGQLDADTRSKLGV